MITVLFLDDDKTRHAEFVRHNAQFGVEIQQSWTAQAAIKCLADMPRFNFIFLDHDLADIHYNADHDDFDEKTGMEVVDYMCKTLPKEKWPDTVIVHSWNPGRSVEMEKRLVAAGFNTIRSQFDAKRYIKL